MKPHLPGCVGMVSHTALPEGLASSKGGIRRAQENAREEASDKLTFFVFCLELEMEEP